MAVFIHPASKIAQAESIHLTKLLKSFLNSSSSLNLLEICSSNGIYTNSSICSTFSSLYSYKQCDINFYRCNMPSFDYTEMINTLRNDSSSFLYLPYVKTYFTTMSKNFQVVPHELLHLSYIFMILSGISKSIPADDHVFGSLTKDKNILDQRKKQAQKDLIRMIEPRYYELRQDGLLVFSLEGMFDQTQYNVWDLFHETLVEAANRNLIFHSEIKSMEIRSHFRTVDEINDSFKEVSDFVSIQEIDSYSIEGPFAKGDRDIEMFVAEALEFWGILPAMNNVLRLFRKPEEKTRVLGEIMKIFEEKLRAKTPEAAAKYHLIVLKKK